MHLLTTAPCFNASADDCTIMLQHYQAPSSTMRAFVQSGRVPPSTGITMDTIQDGEFYGLGHYYPPDDLFAEDPSGMRKIMAMMSVWGKMDASKTAAVNLETALFEKILAKLQPGETIKDLFIAVTGQ